MIPYPTVITTKNPMRLAGTPRLMKVLTVKYLFPNSSVMEMAVTLGNPEVGNPIAADAKSAVPITNKLAWFEGKLSPTSLTKGTMIKAATV